MLVRLLKQIIKRDLIRRDVIKNDIFDSNPLIFTVKTDNTGVSNNDQFTLPLVSVGTYDFYVDWGDGSPIDHITVYNQTEVTHTFAGGAGTYTPKIWGALRGWAFNNSGDPQKFIGINQVGIFDHSNEDGAFYGCSNLTSIAATDKPLIKAGSTDIVGFFRGCGLTTIDWDLYDFSTVEDATNFLNGVTLTTSNIEILLSNLANNINSLQDTVTIHLGSGTYSIGDPATTIYNLTTDKSWTITSGGLKYSYGLRYWADFADTSTITDTSNAVDSVADKSLNSVTLTATTTQRPTTNTRTLNGLNVLDFNGSSNFMTFSPNSVVSEPFTIFVVAQVDATTAQTIIGRQTAATAGQWTLIKNGGYPIFQTYGFGSGGVAGGAVKNYNNNPNIHTISFANGATTKYQLNNDTIATDGVVVSGYNNSVATPLVIGSSVGTGNFLNGCIGEIIIFAGVLTTDEINEITSDYLNSKWGVY